ncbi:MAG: hypothetical protein ACRENP_26465 [Longimicrobiales bacterium]
MSGKMLARSPGGRASAIRTVRRMLNHLGLEPVSPDAGALLADTN